MKFFYLLAFCLLFIFESQAFPLSGNRIILRGKVTADGSGVSVASRLTVSTDGLSLIELETDREGKFSTTLPADVSTCNLMVSAPGFEPEEKELSIRNLKTDSAIYVDILLTPIEKLKLSGMVFDKKTNQPVTAEFDLYFDTDIVKEGVEITSNGKYEEVFTNYGWYLIDISAKGYLNTTDTIWVTNCSRHEMKRDFFMTPFEEGLTVRMKNIQFNFGKTSLHPDSYEELNSVAELLKENPTLQLEIGGHTDDEGADDYNLMLSQGRAQSVVNYLLSQGVAESQLTAKGYGESKPVDPANTKVAKALNRRVEFMILQH